MIRPTMFDRHFEDVAIRRHPRNRRLGNRKESLRWCGRAGVGLGRQVTFWIIREQCFSAGLKPPRGYRKRLSADQPVRSVRRSVM